MRTIIKSKHAKDNPNREAVQNQRGTAEANAHEAADERLLAAGVSHEERHQLIAEAAYFKAVQRSFAPGHELDDWLGAEAEVDNQLSGKRSEDLNTLI